MKRLVLFLVLVLSFLVWSPTLAADPTLSSIRASPSTVAGGGTVKVTVTLSSTAQSSERVELSSNSSYALVDEAVRVSAGRRTVTFDVVTRSTSSSRTAILTAKHEGLTRTATIKINALALSSVSVSPSVLTSQSEVTGTVRLNGAAPSGGYLVDLAPSTNPLFNIPGSVTVPAGKTSVAFVVSADLVESAFTAPLTATAESLSKTVNVQVAPLAITRLSGSSAVTGGNASSARITFNGKTAANTAVSLASSQPSFLTVPASFTVQPGLATQTFPFTTASTTVERTITVTATYRGVVKSYTVVLKPVAVASVSVSPSTLVSTQPATATVKLTGPAPDGGLVVALSDDSSNLTIDPSVTVAEGALTATAPITSTLVSSSRSVVISASVAGVAKTAKVTLVPVTVSTFVPRSSPIGGNDTSLVITLNAVAPAGGLVVELTSANPDVITLPTTVTVPAGQKTLTVAYAPAVVSADTAVAVSVRHLGVAKPATVSVKAARITSLALSATTTTGGRPVDATITLTGPAPAGGLSVDVATALDATSVGTVNPFVSPPASVVVPAGARSVAFSLTTRAVTAKTIVRITTSKGIDSDLAKLTVDAAVFQDVNPRPLSVAPNGASPMTIRLSGIAPTGGVTVTLSSTKPEIATVPASVLIPAGSSSVAVNVTGASGALVGTSTTIKATALGKLIETVATVSDLTISNVTLNVTEIVGGNNVTGTVTLSAVAPPGGLSVGLTVSDDTLTIPANVTIAAGSATSAPFTIKTPLVQTTKSVVVTGRFGSSVRTDDLTVLALEPVSLDVADSTIDAGQATTVTITLDGSTPPSTSMDVVAAISASPAKVIFPATVEFGQSDTTVDFTVTGVAVTTDTLVTITATVNGVSVTDTVTIRAAGVQGVALNPAAVTGGSPSTGTVTLTTPAPSGGRVVGLTSSNAAASVPATVTVPVGSLSATFSITTPAVSSDTTAVITATVGSSVKTATLAVASSLLKSLSVNDADLEGGFANATGTVTLDAPAPAGGAQVTLSSSVSGAASVTSTVTVLAGQTTATFAITSSLTASDTPVTITATKGATFTQAITVRSIKVSDLSLSKTSTQGGTGFSATVTINRAVKDTGVSVTIASGNAAIAGTTVIVPINATTVSVDLTTTAVASDQSVALTASFNGGSSSENISVLAPVVTSVTASPATLVGGTATSAGTVTISHAAPAGFVVALSASNGGAEVGANVTVPTGQTTAAFTITTNVVAADRSVTIAAARNGVEKTTQIVVTPLIVSVIEIDPTSVMGGGSVTGTLTLNGLAPAGGAVVNLASDDTGYATVPATVTIPAGTASVIFPVTTFANATPDTVTISMTFNGRTKSADLAVQAPTPSSLAISPATVVGGGQVTATVELNSPAAAGQTLSISSNNPIAIPPASVEVAEGDTTATFPVNTGAIGADATVTLSVTGNSVSVTQNLTVTAPNLTALTVSGDSVLGGGELTATATISSPAPAAGLTIAVSASPARTSTISIGIAAGATSGTATFVTQGVLADTVVTLTGSFDGISQSDTFTILRTTVASIATDVPAVTGGNSFQFTVTLNGVAPVGGMSITGIDTSGNIAMPSSIVVPAGATSVTIIVGTSDVATDQTKQVGVQFDGVDRYIDITLLA